MLESKTMDKKRRKVVGAKIGDREWPWTM